MKLKLVFDSHPYGNCYACPAREYKVEATDEMCKMYGESIDDCQPCDRCPAVLDQSDEIRAGELAALKTEILRLQALVRGEV